MPRPSDFAQDGWPVAGQEDDETEYIGTTTPGNPMVYNANEHTLFGVEVDEQKQRLEPIGNTVQNLGADETISDAINRVGEELGWSSLSEFGEGESQQDES